MAEDKLDLVVEISAHTQGLEGIPRQASLAQDALEALARTGAIGEEALDALSKAGEKVSATLGGTGSSAKKQLSAFDELQKSVQKTTKALRDLAQEDVVSGGRSPLKNVSETIGLDEAQKIIAVLEAQSVTAGQVAKQVVNAEKEKQAAFKATADAAEAAAKRVSQTAQQENASSARNRNQSRSGGLWAQGQLYDTGSATKARETSWAREAEAVKSLNLQYDAHVKAYDRVLAERSAASQQTAIYNQYLYDQEIALQKANKATDAAATSLPTLRYALYDVAQTAGIMSAAVSATGGAVLSASASYESSFTKVERTSGVTGASVQDLRDDLLGLARVIPQSFGEISDLAARGAQLGIAADQLEGFTEVVAQFVATSDTVSLDQAVEAFGRISNLMGDTNFNAIGSAITLVGVNAAATEGQIVKTTQELAPFATAVGMSTDEVIGLSTALASLGQPPERARSAFLTLQRVMDNAIASGSDNLQSFATLLGQTTDEVSTLWKQDPGQFVESFSEALGSVEDLTTTFADLGINERRAVQVFQALAADARNAGDGVSVLQQAFQDANKGYTEGSELARQYSLIVDDLASRWQIFVNSLGEFAAQVGGTLAPAAKVVLDVLSRILQGLTDMAKSPVGRTVIVIAGALGVLTAGAAALIATVALSVASLAAFKTALSQLNIPAGTSLLTLRGLSAAFTQVGVTAGYSTESVNRFKGALVRTGIGALVVVLGTLAAAFMNTGQSAEQAFSDYVGNIGGLAEAVAADKAAYDAAVAEGNTALAASFIDAGSSSQALTTAVDDNREAMEAAAGLLGVTRAGVDEVSDAVENQSVILGQNTIDWLNNSLITSEAFQKLAQNSDFAATWEEYGLTMQEVLEAAAANGEQGVLDLFARVGNAANNGAGVFLSGLQAFFQRIADSWNHFWSSVGTQMSKSWNALISGNLKDFASAQISGPSDLWAGWKDIWTQPVISNNVREFAKAASGAVVQARELGSAGRSAAGAFDDFEDSIPDSLNDTGDAAGGAAREVRTLVDYAGDLRKVWSRAFEIRFSGQSSLDAIRSTYIGIQEAAEKSAEKMAGFRKAIEDSRRTIQGLKADIQGLQSDINIQEYFLSIAVEYGDTQRAEAIEANLAKLRADLAEKTADLREENDKISKSQKDLAAEQANSSKTLVGNSKAAIENRKTIQGLVEQYQAHIGALAASGMSQSDLAKATARLRKDFLRQASQLGFNRGQLEKYASAFDDVSYAIAHVPRNITVKIDPNPAVTALREIQAAAEKAGRAVSGVGGGGGGFGGGGGGLSSGSPVSDLAGKILQDATRAGVIASNLIQGARSAIEKDSKDLGVLAEKSFGQGIQGQGGASSKKSFSDIWLKLSGISKIAAAASGKDSGGSFVGDYSTRVSRSFGEDVSRAMQAGKSGIDRRSSSLGTASGSAIVSSGRSQVRTSFGSQISSGMSSGSRSISGRGTTLGRTAGNSLTQEASSRTRTMFGTRVSNSMLSNPISARASSIGGTIASHLRSGISSAFDFILGSGTTARRVVKSVTGFQSGGFTGFGAASEPAGIVHRGEYVIPKRDVNQSTGLPYADALGRLMSGVPGTPSGGGSGAAGASNGVVIADLSAQSLRFLAEAVSTQLVIDGRVIGDAANRSYTRDNRVGAN